MRYRHTNLNCSNGGQSQSYAYHPADNRTRPTWPEGYSISTDYDA